MTGRWTELIAGERWRSSATLWIEDGVEYSWRQVGELAAAIEAVIAGSGPVRVLRIRSESKLGCFAGQLAGWRAGCVVVADDGNLGPGELEQVRPDLSVTVAEGSAPDPVLRPDRQPARGWLPDEAVAVNFTSGSTGSRKAVGVSRGNLLALFGCRDLQVPTPGGLTAASFATPTYDGWWFDTWAAVARGGTVVCLPSVNEDVFGWPELIDKYQVDRLLLPAAVVATLVDAVPECIAGVPWLFSGGEQFLVSTYRKARRAGLRNRFVNLYGPTEATFATHKYELPAEPAATIPIGKPLDGCRQSLREVDRGTGCYELVVAGPLVCLGYLEAGRLAHPFDSGGGQRSFATGDLVRPDENGDLVFAGRLDSQLKVNGMRVDAAAVEHAVTRLPEVSGCRVVQDGARTVAFVQVEAGSPPAGAGPAIESVVRAFSTAIAVELVPRFPVKSGGKVDTAALLSDYHARDKGREDD